ncbi:MAG: hypothetical protein AB8B49_03495 [Nitratireductor sp.]
MENIASETPIDNAVKAPSVPKTGSDVFSILRKRNKKTDGTAAARRHIRHECKAIGVLSIINRSISLEGIVLEIARGGIKFRPAKVHLLDRKGDQVSVSIGGLQLTGKIVAVRNDGYGIALFDELEDDVLDPFLEEYAV